MTVAVPNSRRKRKRCVLECVNNYIVLLLNRAMHPLIVTAANA